MLYESVARDGVLPAHARIQHKTQADVAGGLGLTLTPQQTPASQFSSITFHYNCVDCKMLSFGGRGNAVLSNGGW